MQALAWNLCNEDSPDLVVKRMQCATMTVPQDWNRPNAGVDLRVAISRLRPVKGEPVGSVIGNPGGPGGAGLAMPALLAHRPKLAEKMELVGFDPRGTGDSTNVTCDGAPLPTIDARDRRRAALNLIGKAAKLYAEYCSVRSGQLLDHITTEQTVKDMDLIRVLLKRPKIHFVGYSGGSWMGAYYATYFPKNTGNFILDSNAQFTGAWSETFMQQPLGFERRFRQDFAPWAAKHNSEVQLGATVDEVRKTYEKLRADYARSPLDEETPEGERSTTDGNVIDNVIAQNLYSKHQFGDLVLLFHLLRLFWAVSNAEAGEARAAQEKIDALPRAHRALLTDSLRRAQLPVRPLAADASDATFWATCNQLT